MTTTPPTGQRVGSDDAGAESVDPTRREDAAGRVVGRDDASGAAPEGSRPARPRTSAPAADAAAPVRSVGSEPGEFEAPSPADEAGAAPRRLLGYRRQRFEARKVRRLVRHIDPWSMLKLSLLLALCMWLIVMIAGVVLWTVASNAGTIESVESFVNSSLSLQDWQLEGDVIFRQFGLITLLLALGSTAAAVISALVFNLVSDIIGGVWISVIEEETARPVAESNDPS